MLTVNYLQHSDSHKGTSREENTSLFVSETHRSCVSLVITQDLRIDFLSAPAPACNRRRQRLAVMEAAGADFIPGSITELAEVLLVVLECHLVGLVSLSHAFQSGIKHGAGAAQYT